MNTITEEIQKLMAAVKDFKAAGVDPKTRNKVYARLEEAWLWSQHMIKLDAPTFPVEAECTCPEGAKSTLCAVHGNTFTELM